MFVVRAFHLSQPDLLLRLEGMKPHEFEALKRAVALTMMRDTLASADFSCGVEKLTESQLEAYEYAEMLYYDGEWSYGDLWSLIRPKTRS